MEGSRPTDLPNPFRARNFIIPGTKCGALARLCHCARRYAPPGVKRYICSTYSLGLSFSRSRRRRRRRGCRVRGSRKVPRVNGRMATLLLPVHTCYVSIERVHLKHAACHFPAMNTHEIMRMFVRGSSNSLVPLIELHRFIDSNGPVHFFVCIYACVCVSV